MQSNNMKAMREALEQIAKLMDRILVRTELDDEIHRIALEAQNMADGVLSLSPRNCDVGTAEEQAQRFNDYCKKQGDGCSIGKSKGACPMFKGYQVDCAIVWAQMPYEEGGEAE